MFRKQKRADPFAHLLGEEAAAAPTGAPAETVGEEEQEYVSPFRDPEAVIAAQRRRLARYPTTSASSAYATAKPEELGYRGIGVEERRAKDIQFPTYLQENERKQLVALKELEMKENHLRYLRDSQRVYKEEELKPAADDEAESAEETTEPEVEESEPAESAAVKAEVAEEAAEPLETTDADAGVADEIAVTEPVEKTELAEVPVDATKKDTDVEPAEVTEPVEITEPAADAKPVEEMDADADATEPAVKVAQPAESSKKPVDSASIDPLAVPMVVVPLKDHRPFFKKLFKSAPVPAPNPEATPENPEEVVKTTDGRYLTKAVFDKVSAQNREHDQWIADFVAQEKQKYNDKRANSNRRINSLRAEIKQIKDDMEELRKDTDSKIEVKENELTRKLFESIEVYIKEKNKVFKETELLKTQKLAEKDSVIGEQSEVQRDIDELNEKKGTVQAEYIKWSNNIADLSAHIDAKVAKLAEIDRRHAKTAGEIEALEKEKQALLSEAEENDAKHEQNTKVIEDAKNKTYLPRVNEIDGKISVLLTQLTTVKQQCANEKTELAAITKKLEQERIAHEEKLKLEAEERKRKEEDLLNKQKEELEAKAQEARLRHEEEMKKLREDYNELEAKFKEEQQQKKDAIAFANSHKGLSRDSSLFEYGTEEEILSL